MLYRELYIWLRVPGGVVGYNLEYMNEKIDYYNRNAFLRSTGDFWGWLSWEEGETISGYSAIWNEGNPLFSQLHIIKGGNNNVK